ncbi:LuxR C-terminal-related transcriptional regulator [Cohaesibacter haloalkalitolerans]|jgi:DNA-binding NarL/FixJ family response regulator|uniref:LuxR C-terminal-related transcriptional regulator n=1 Tax=Cohaesibacter haloalkalitolerans TaxID=1162980 RepID=UPI000E65647B|nr:response regulator transcription factor [Cohaesibacter haloalkalitolerans]
MLAYHEHNQPVEFRSALIVDDHPLFCDALCMTLQAVSSIRSIHTVNSLQDALDIIIEHDSPDLIVLDLNLPDVQGLDGLLRLRNTTRSPIVVISSMADNRIISSVIHTGASGFIPKHSNRSIFQKAIETLAEGKKFIPAGYVLLENSPALSEDETIKRMASLTNQQGRILQLICEGKLNKQIAFDLSIAETTVKAHVTAIMRKLGVQSRTQAVLMAKKTSFGHVSDDGESSALGL